MNTIRFSGFYVDTNKDNFEEVASRYLSGNDLPVVSIPCAKHSLTLSGPEAKKFLDWEEKDTYNYSKWAGDGRQLSFTVLSQPDVMQDHPHFRDKKFDNGIEDVLKPLSILA
jgi:hypothetical protein